MEEKKLSRVYSATSQSEQEAAYDEWSASYERDLFAMGYRLPTVGACVFARYVVPGSAAILDAGCGGGLQAEPLAVMGYDNITGIDLSEGMLSVARAKGIYRELRQMALGGRLDFDDNQFDAILSTGVITPGHAPAESLVDLLRIARPGAPIVFSLRVDAGTDPTYRAICERLEGEGRWRKIFATQHFVTMPYGEPDILSQVNVYEVAT